MKRAGFVVVRLRKVIIKNKKVIKINLIVTMFENCFSRWSNQSIRNKISNQMLVFKRRWALVNDALGQQCKEKTVRED